MTFPFRRYDPDQVRRVFLSPDSSFHPDTPKVGVKIGKNSLSRRLLKNSALLGSNKNSKFEMERAALISGKFTLI